VVELAAIPDAQFQESSSTDRYAVNNLKREDSSK